MTYPNLVPGLNKDTPRFDGAEKGNNKEGSQPLFAYSGILITVEGTTFVEQNQQIAHSEKSERKRISSPLLLVAYYGTVYKYLYSGFYTMVSPGHLSWELEVLEIHAFLESYITPAQTPSSHKKKKRQ